MRLGAPLLTCLVCDTGFVRITHLADSQVVELMYYFINVG